MQIDYLNEDPKIEGQQWFCISFLSPEGLRNTTVRGVKVRGVFATQEEAEKRARDLREIDPAFHVFVGEMGKWTPWDPSPDDKTKVKDSEYYESELQSLMKKYNENMEKAKLDQEKRKRNMMQKPREPTKTNKKGEINATKIDMLKKKVIKTHTEMKNVNKKPIKIDKNIDVNKIMETRDKELKSAEGDKKELQEIENKISKMKELYNKLKNEQS